MDTARTKDRPAIKRAVENAPYCDLTPIAVMRFPSWGFLRRHAQRANSRNRPRNPFKPKPAPSSVSSNSAASGRGGNTAHLQSENDSEQKTVPPMTTGAQHPGIVAALSAATLFGVGVPLAKLLLEAMSPWLLAGLLYAGSGIGLAILRRCRGKQPVKLASADIGWLLGAVITGGVIGPVLLMWGLSTTSASTASLLLNAEGVLTALIAWLVFHENFDRRIALGMLCIVAGAVVLSWPQDQSGAVAGGSILSALAIIGACLAWAIDNNFTRKVSLADATFIAMAKGLVAGGTNICVAFALGSQMPGISVVSAALVLGFLSYGGSLVLFIVALRHLGTARTGAYFSIAPFAGAVIAVLLLGEPVSPQILIAGVLMGVGVWLHITERHAHEHAHEELEHEHEHEHDEHHQHSHDEQVGPGVRHSHQHRHEALTHTHPHFPDAHHRHRH